MRNETLTPGLLTSTLSSVSYTGPRITMQIAHCNWCSCAPPSTHLITLERQVQLGLWVAFCGKRGGWTVRYPLYELTHGTVTTLSYWTLITLQIQEWRRQNCINIKISPELKRKCWQTLWRTVSILLVEHNSKTAFFEIYKIPVNLN